MISMPRQPRYLLGDGIFHVTARGVARMTIYRDETDFTWFLRLLEAVVPGFNWRRHAYCLMPNHYHLVLKATLDDLSRGMHRLNSRYAQGFNQRYERTGHLFQDRFGARLIESEDYLADACDYVINNPVRAELCATAGEWPWSGLDV
jgi:putative transposase